MENRRSNTVLPASADNHKKAERLFIFTLIGTEEFILSQAGQRTFIVISVDINDALYQGSLKFIASFICADVEMSAYHSDLIGLRIYVERYLLILCYFKVCLSVQFHISVAAPEVRAISQRRFRVQPNFSSVRQRNLCPLTGRNSNRLQLCQFIIPVFINQKSATDSYDYSSSDTGTPP